jgi:hypothetical protein
MEQLNTVRTVEAEDIRKNDFLRGQLALRAYQIQYSSPSTVLSERFASYDLAMIAQKIDAIPSLTIGQQMLPIEFSEQGEK